VGTSRIVEEVWGTRRFVRRRSTLTDNRGASLRAAFYRAAALEPLRAAIAAAGAKVEQETIQRRLYALLDADA
jgi:hypothetical protein